jgi:hypothetical protein
MTDPDIADQDTLLDPDEKDIEAPDADALEQRTPADPTEAAQHQPLQPTRSLEVNEADALEQARVVDLDDDY